MPLLPPVTTATLPASEKGCSVILATSSVGRDHLRQDRVEAVGRLELHPVPGAGDDLEAGTRLKAAQHARALVEMGIGGRVASAPMPSSRALTRGRARASVSARENLRLLTRPRGAFWDWM